MPISWWGLRGSRQLDTTGTFQGGEMASPHEAFARLRTSGPPYKEAFSAAIWDAIILDHLLEAGSPVISRNYPKCRTGPSSTIAKQLLKGVPDRPKKVEGEPPFRVPDRQNGAGRSGLAPRSLRHRGAR